MKMVRISKCIAVIAVLSLLSGLFAGCGTQSVEKQTESTAVATTATAVETKKEPVELSIYSWMFDLVALTDDAPIYKFYQDKFNIKFKVVSTNYNNWEEKLGLLIASGEMPDIFINPGPDKRDQYNKWVKEGLILPISDYSSKYPNVDNVIKQFDKMKTSLGGKLHVLPLKLSIESDKSISNMHTMFIRKDWLDSLGLSMPTNLDEFYNVLNAFANNDPDKNNKKDTYGLSCTSAGGGIWWFYQVFNLFNTSFDRFMKVNGKWIPETTSSEMKEAVAFLKKLNDDKILDPEFMLNTEDQQFQKLLKGKIGVMLGNETMYNTYFDAFKQAYPDKDPKSMFTWIPVMTGKNGQKRMDGSNSYYLYTSINANIGEEKINKALELLNFELSNEGLDLLRWGIEGVHYKKDGDKYVNLLPKDDKGVQKTISKEDGTVAVFYLAASDVDFLPEGSPNREDIISMKKSSNDAAKEDPLNFMSITNKDFDQTLPAKLYDITTKSFIEMITKAKDFDAAWTEYTSNWMNQGGQVYIDETNKQAQAEGR